MNEEKLKNKLVFSVDSAEVIEDNPDSRFITCKIHVFSSGLNYHNLFCTEDVLRKTAPTIYNMPVIYNLINNDSDFGTHTDPDKSLICGFAIPDTGTFETIANENGEEVLGFFVDAKIWKIYVPAVYEILEKRDGKVGISVEMWLYDSHIDEITGTEDMDDFCYFGICLLGASIKSAIDNAELQVLSFSQINEKYQEDYVKEFSKYSSIDFSISQEIKKNSTKGLELYKQYGIGGNSFALTVARHLSKNEKANPEKIKSVNKYLLYHQNDSRKKSPVNASHINWMLYGGDEALEWSKNMVGKMKEVDDKPMSYFDNGEVLTFPYSSLKDINPALGGIKPSVSLSQANLIAKQADAIGADKDGWPEAIASFKKRYHIENGRWVKNKTEKEELSVDENKDEKDLKKKEPEVEEMATKDVKADEDKPETPEEEKKEQEKEGENKDETPAEEKAEEAKEKDEAKEEAKEEKDKPKEEKKMSLDENLDMAALMQMLVDETEDNQVLADQYTAGEEMDYSLLCSKLFAKVKKMQSDADAANADKDVYMAENAKLKEYKDKIEKQQFDYAVEKTIQEVSDVLTKDEIDNAREEIKAFNIETLPAWQSNIKSLAFSRIKDNPKKKESFTRMATVNSWLTKNNEPEDATKEYAKKGWL